MRSGVGLFLPSSVQLFHLCWLEGLVGKGLAEAREQPRNQRFGRLSQL